MAGLDFAHVRRQTIPHEMAGLDIFFLAISLAVSGVADRTFWVKVL